MPTFPESSSLLPAVIQDARDSRVLMVGYMNQEAYERTLRERLVTLWSRSRNTLWRKGDTSGNRLVVVSIHEDCDHDTLLVKAIPVGPVCHTGSPTCFADDPGPLPGILAGLEETIRERKTRRPQGSYTTSLFEKGTAAIAQKVGEEATETIVAALSQGKEQLVEESADLLYHLLVLLTDRGVTLEEVLGELARRTGSATT